MRILTLLSNFENNFSLSTSRVFCDLYYFCYNYVPLKVPHGFLSYYNLWFEFPKWWLSRYTVCKEVCNCNVMSPSGNLGAIDINVGPYGEAIDSHNEYWHDLHHHGIASEHGLWLEGKWFCLFDTQFVHDFWYGLTYTVVFCTILIKSWLII